MASIGRLAVPALLAGVAAGIFAADTGILGPRWLPLLVVAGAVGATGATALRRTAAAVVLGGLLAGLGLGSWVGASATLPTGAGSVEMLVGHEVALSGEVLEDPRPREDRQQLTLGDLRRDETPVSGRLLLWLPRGIAVEAGDRLGISGEPELAEDFDGFAYREYLARQGIGAIVRAQAAEVIGHETSPVQEVLRPLRGALLGGFVSVIPEPEAALGAGILLGVRSGIAPEVSDAFAAAGLTHVVAISGWNIAIVAAVVAAGLRPLRGRRGSRWAIAPLTAAAIAFYVMLTGASPSVVRAGLMAGAMLVAQLGGSRTRATSALMLAALVMLIAAPPVLWDVGFQLSLLATAGLILLGGSVERRMTWLPGWAREPIALTLASQVTTLPIILLNFERLSLVAPAANVVVAPLVPIVMLVGSLAMVATALHGAVPIVADLVAMPMAGATWLVLRLMILAGGAAAAVPFASVAVSAPGWLAAGYYPALGLVLARRKPPAASPTTAPEPSAPTRWTRMARWCLHPATIAAAIGIALLVISLQARPDGRLHVTALDIGQGDAILVTTPAGTRMLVDGGPDPDLTLRRLGEVMPWWDRRIDLVLLTHPHEDHVAGLVDVLRRFEVRAVLEPGRAYENPSYARFLGLAASEPGAVTRQPRAGESLLLDPSTHIDVLYPSVADAAAPLLEDDVNNGSVVVSVRCGGFGALLTGDAEAPVEALLVERGLQRVDLLKVGHHGSESSSSPAFLAASHARIGLISAGIGNEYGHPRPATLAALAADGVSVFRTDLDGTIDVATDGRTMVVRSRRGLLAASVATPAAGCGGGTQGSAAPASIGPWPSPTSPALARSSIRSRFLAASLSTPRASAAWRRRRRGWCRRRAFRSTSASSRSPPSSTISTSSRRATGPASMAWWGVRSWIGSATRSWRRRSPRTR
jgi:competence protein ComEC